MKISLIAAVADNGVIGKDGDVPWHLPEDLRRFKRRTWGHHLVMGRKTYDSVGRPLPGRTTVVVTRQPGWRAPGAPGVCVARSLDQALEIARRAGEEEVFVAGGAEIYRLALPRADRFYLTRVEAEPEGDTFFPAFDEGQWCLVSEEHRPADAENPHPQRFLVYER